MGSSAASKTRSIKSMTALTANSASGALGTGAAAAERRRKLKGTDDSEREDSGAE